MTVLPYNLNERSGNCDKASIVAVSPVPGYRTRLLHPDMVIPDALFAFADIINGHIHIKKVSDSLDDIIN